jgi:hypothetical protein
MPTNTLDILLRKPGVPRLRWNKIGSVCDRKKRQLCGGGMKV